MLDAFNPLANVLISISEGHGALTILLVHYKKANIDFTITVGKFTFTVERVVPEVALVSSIRFSEVSDTLTAELVILYFALVVAAVDPLVATLSILESLVE